MKTQLRSVFIVLYLDDKDHFIVHLDVNNNWFKSRWGRVEDLEFKQK